MSGPGLLTSSDPHEACVPQFAKLTCKGFMQGKISREDIADLCAALLETPAACDTTFEIKSTVPFSQPFEVDPSRPLPPRNWQARGSCGAAMTITMLRVLCSCHAVLFDNPM